MNEIDAMQTELDDWRQAAAVEADLRREYQARAEKAEAEVVRLNVLVESEARRAEDAHGEVQRLALKLARIETDIGEAVIELLKSADELLMMFPQTLDVRNARNKLALAAAAIAKAPPGSSA